MRQHTLPASSAECPGSPVPLPLGEVSPKVTERASQKRQSRSAAISRFFVRARLSQDAFVYVSILALSGAHAPEPGCGSQRLLRCRSHPAGRGPNSSSLFPPLAAVVAVARKGLLAPFRPRRSCRSPKMLAASLNAFFGLLRFTAPPMVLRFSRTLRSAKA